jgi:hypothetical protein
MKRGTFLLLFYVAGLLTPAFAQKSIKGKVTSANSRAAIANCDVFVNGTCAGTKTDMQGNFELANVPAGQHDLIVVAKGYQPFFISFTDNTLPVETNPVLEPMPLATSEYSDPENRTYLTDVFSTAILGPSGNLDKCSIKNPRVLKFWYYDNGNKLKVTTDEPLRIINNALGYEISYRLSHFEMDMNTGLTSFDGYSLFKEMEPKNHAQQEKWGRYRMEAWNGSLCHFLKSLYAGSLKQEGFTVYQLRQTENAERGRVKEMYNDVLLSQSRRPKGGANKTVMNTTGIPADSMAYYRKVMESPDSIEFVRDKEIDANSLLVKGEEMYKILTFAGSLEVSYHKKYYARVRIPRQPEADLISYMGLAKSHTVSIDAFGNYYEPDGIVYNGNWVGGRGLADLLPAEYSGSAITVKE